MQNARLKDFIKNYVEEFLLRALFLKSCDIAGIDLTNKSFKDKSLVKAFREKISDNNNLPVKVQGGIFGSGGYSNCNYIAFLGEKQEVSSGFYPVLLFYRKLKNPILIVSYGISAENKPTKDWYSCKNLQISSLPSIDHFFDYLVKNSYLNNQELSKYKLNNKSYARYKYGNSIFHTAYRFKLVNDISGMKLMELINSNNKEELKEFLFEKFAIFEKYLIKEFNTEEKGSVFGKEEKEIKIKSLVEKLSEDLDKIILDYLTCLQAIQNVESPTNTNTYPNLTYFGPPGTGKTYRARKEAEKLSNRKSENVNFITFHPSFAYENFIEGIWPEVKDGQIRYTIKDGILKELSIEAMWNALIEKKRRGN